MINKVWKNDFEFFLTSKNLLDLFNSYYYNENINFKIDIYDTSNDIFDYFFNAFDWTLTKEGESFWDDINELWYDYVEENDLMKYDVIN